MFPLRDHNPSERRPVVTYGLLAANTLVFLFMLPLYGSSAASEIFVSYGMIPARLSQGAELETLITSMFLHGGFMHFAGNMLFLWIFGDNLEDMLGHVKFLLFYLATGIAAALLQYVTDPSSAVPMIGASGAIAGVMGGYLLLFPKARVDVLFIIVIIIRVIPIPAWAALLVWFGLQLFNGVASFGAEGGGVAHWAHAGGFIAGFAIVLPLWLRLGAQRFWERTDGHPDHPEAKYKLTRSSIPRTGRRRR
ncbi:rhomboid family intramembrane serine protease [Aliiroseovarius sp. F20344]|uniref:rhomboid family intramembrane serine protease n=1 Tax=Aliiroseovarius sp. F20344 TaxID=2926414 RepID=UPI001FF6C71B|nr:rhomboid family intramembrane serine protease [Aliiroseovarius sp. F20344]MCK0143040.1 rhomboid family intramembrane serine protease [Aliiroseovarius sp. F20344]